MSRAPITKTGSERLRAEHRDPPWMDPCPVAM